MDDSDLPKFIKSHEQHIKDIKDTIFRISWYMRGGVNSHDLFHTYSREDRLIMDKIISENIETTKSSGLAII